MDEQVARAIVWIGVAVAAGSWLWGVRTVARASRNEAEQPPGQLPIQPESRTSERVTAGEVSIAGPPAEMAARLARSLAEGQLSVLGAVRVTAADAERVCFEQLEPQNAFRVADGEVTFLPGTDGSTRARYFLAGQGGRGLLVAARVVLVLGLIAIVTMAALMETFVISNPDPAVRMQCIQTVQLVHFLWPPFALAASYRRGRRLTVRRLEALLANLPHLG